MENIPTSTISTKAAFSKRHIRRTEDQSDIADIEGNNAITIDSCKLTCSGSSRGVMLYRSGATVFTNGFDLSYTTLTNNGTLDSTTKDVTAIDTIIPDPS